MKRKIWKPFCNRKEPFRSNGVSSRSSWLHSRNDPFLQCVVQISVVLLLLLLCICFCMFGVCLYVFTLRYNPKSSVWHLLVRWPGWIWWWTNPETAHPRWWCITFSHCQSTNFVIEKKNEIISRERNTKSKLLFFFSQLDAKCSIHTHFRI